MKVLVIPDVHLKPHIFRRAAELMRTGIAHQAVCLMDIADNWGKEYDRELYEETYDAAIEFAKKFPESLWCWGNHDLSYRWHCYESGYSSMASYTVHKKILDLREALAEDNRIQYVHKVDNVLFSHGGILELFVKDYIPEEYYEDTETVVREINNLGKNEMWNDKGSPIWLRPQYLDRSLYKLYKSETLLQVVGHTPVKQITREGNLISCDVFSTYRNGKVIGTEEFLLLDTETWEYKGIK